MSVNLTENIDATPSTRWRKSRRLRYIVIVGICSIVCGVWLYSVYIQDGTASAVEHAQNIASQPTIPNYGNLQPNYGNLQYAQNVIPDLRQNLLQDKLPSGMTFAPNPPTIQTRPQDPAENNENTANVEINQLRNQLRSASGDQKKELRKALTDAVGKLFDLRHEAQAKQVAKLEAELAEAKELHKKRSERKDEIVERRIAELLQSADDLAWNRDLAGQPTAAPNYALPNGYGSTYPQNAMYQNPNTVYSAPGPGNYRTNPYSTIPNITPPGAAYPSPFPQSSTPPQFIPLSTQDTGQTSLLNAAPMSESAPSFTPPPTPTAGETEKIVPNPAEVTAMVYVESNQDPQVKGFYPIDANGQLLSSLTFTAKDVPRYLHVYAEGIVPPSEPGATFADERIKQVLPLLRELEPQRSQLRLKSIHVGQPELPKQICSMKIETSDKRQISWGHAPGYETPGEPKTDEKLSRLLIWSADFTLGLQIDLTLPSSGSPNDAGDTEPSKPSAGNPLTTASNLPAANSLTSKAVIEAAYAYEEALDVYAETKTLYLKGAAGLREMSASKRSAAKTKAIWEAMRREFELQQKTKKDEVNAKQFQLNETSKVVERAQLQTELSKLELELQSIAETIVWAEDFNQQSITTLEKRSEETKVDDKKADVPEEKIEP